MEEKSLKNYNPVYSLLRFLLNWVTLKIHFVKDYNGKKITMKNDVTFEIFRHVIVGDKVSLKNEKGVIFIVKFKLSKMSVENNILFSLLPIPMFIGLPGLRAKFWCLNIELGYNQGIYQWKTEKDAINYSRSFAVDFMTKRSEIGSVSYEIIKNENIYNYIEERTKEQSILS